MYDVVKTSQGVKFKITEMEYDTLCGQLYSADGHRWYTEDELTLEVKYVPASTVSVDAARYLTTDINTTVFKREYLCRHKWEAVELIFSTKYHCALCGAKKEDVEKGA